MEKTSIFKGEKGMKKENFFLHTLKNFFEFWQISVCWEEARLCLFSYQVYWNSVFSDALVRNLGIFKEKRSKPSVTEQPI